MKRKELTKEVWLEYLNNLNNRELAKQTSNGFTVWALFGLIGFSFFKIIDHLPIIIENIKISILLIATFSNILFTVIILFHLYLIVPVNINTNSKRKIYTKVKESNFTFLYNSIILLSILPFFCNIYVIFNLKYFGLNLILPYTLFAMFEISFMIFVLIIEKSIKKENKIPRIEPWYLYKKHNLNSNKQLLIIFLLSYIFLIYEFIRNINILNYLIIFKSIIYCFVLFGAIFILINIWIIQLKYKCLETIEREIILNNLDVKEIIEIFKNEYIGKDINQWLKQIDDENRKIFSKIENNFNELYKENKDLDFNEKDIRIRLSKAKNILKIRDKVVKKFQKDRSLLIEIVEKNSEKINIFLQQGPMTNEERIIVEECHRNLERYIKKLKSISHKNTHLVKELTRYVDETEKLVEKKESTMKNQG
jgi:hypothetical protein